MIKKTITYTDYDGNQRTEDFYFNLSKAELLKMEMGVDGGLEKYIKKIVSEQDRKEIINAFAKVIELSYGQKTLDGKRFVKSPELFEEFEQTEAYSELIMELVGNAEAAAVFFNGIVPTIEK